MKRVKFRNVNYNIDEVNKKVYSHDQKKLPASYFKELGLTELELYQTLKKIEETILNKNNFLTEDRFKKILNENLVHKSNILPTDYFDQLCKGINYKIIKENAIDSIIELLVKIIDKNTDFSFNLLPNIPISNKFKLIKEKYYMSKGVLIYKDKKTINIIPILLNFLNAHDLI